MQELVNDMNNVELRSYERMAGWMKHSYHGECSAVSAVHKLASRAAFAGQPLPYQLELQVATQPGSHYTHPHVLEDQSCSLCSGELRPMSSARIDGEQSAFACSSGLSLFRSSCFALHGIVAKD